MAEIKKTYSLFSNRKLNSKERIEDDPSTWYNERVYKREGGVYYIAEGSPPSWHRVPSGAVTEEMMLAADELERQNTELVETDSMPLTLLEQSELGLLSEDPQVSEPAVEVESDDSEGTEFETSIN